MAMLNNCQLGLFLLFLEALTRHRCFCRTLVIHWPSSFLNRAWDRLWRSSWLILAYVLPMRYLHVVIWILH